MYGIIDGALGDYHLNIIDSNIKNEIKEGQNHGDSILEFMSQVAPNTSFYYYNAEDEEGISSENILSGLQWMVEHNVDAVSISLSSKYYSRELEEWIECNRDKIRIYASYSNKANTFKCSC